MSLGKLCKRSQFHLESNMYPKKNANFAPKNLQFTNYALKEPFKSPNKKKSQDNQPLTFSFTPPGRG